MTGQHSLLFTMMSSSLENPFAMLAACDRRVQHMLTLLERLSEHLDKIGADKSTRKAASDLMRFFDLAAVHHHDDEELLIVPRLRSLGHHAIAQRILDEHRALSLAWTRIREGLRTLSTHSDELRECLPVRRADWKRFASDYRTHIAFEEREAFPNVETSAESAMSMDIGAQMSRPRGARPRISGEPGQG